jgi:hypothetical protein
MDSRTTTGMGKEVWYKVIDKNTIVDFYRKPLVVSRVDRKKEEYQPKTYLNAETSKFVLRAEYA